MRVSTNYRGGRPMIMSTRGVVAAGHFLAAEAGLHILRSGGNAMDAAAAMHFCLTVLEPHQNGFGGEVPVLVHDASEGRTYAVSGHGVAPAAATIERYARMGVTDIIAGDGFLGALVPPVPATWIKVLERFGTMRLADVMAPAMEIAEGGFAMTNGLRGAIAGAAKRYQEARQRGQVPARRRAARDRHALAPARPGRHVPQADRSRSRALQPRSRTAGGTGPLLPRRHRRGHRRVRIQLRLQGRTRLPGAGALHAR